MSQWDGKFAKAIIFDFLVEGDLRPLLRRRRQMMYWGLERVLLSLLGRQYLGKKY